MDGNESVADRFRRMQEDPQFATFSYADQQRIRAKFLSRTLSDDPDFQSLDAVGQAQAFSKIISLPPVFADPNDPYIKYVTGLADNLKRGEPGAVREAVDRVATDSYLRTLGILGKVGEVVVEHLAGPYGYLADVPKPGTDRFKAMEYLSAVARTPENTTRVGRAVMGLAPLAGVLTNIASGRVIFGGVLGAVRAGSKAIAATRATSRMARWLFSSAIPQVAESTIDGLMMTVADQLQDNPTGSLPEWMPKAQSLLGNIALDFGYNVAQDMLAFTVLRLSGALLGQVFRGVAKPVRGMLGKLHPIENVQKEMSSAEFNEILGDVIAGRTISKEMFNSLPESAQRSITKLRRQWELGKRIGELTPEEKAEFIIGARGVDYEVTKAGRITLRRGDEIIGRGYSSMENALEGLYRIDNLPPETSARVTAAAARNEFEVSKSVVAELQAGVPELGDDIAAAFVPDAGGTLIRENVEAGVRRILRDIGIDPDDIRKVKVVQLDPSDWRAHLRGKLPVEADTVYLPQKVTSTSGLNAMFRRLGKDISGFTELPTRKVVSNVRDALIKTDYNPFSMRRVIENLADRTGIETKFERGKWYVAGKEAATERDALDLLSARFFESQTATPDGIKLIRKLFSKQFGIGIIENDKTGIWSARLKGSGDVLHATSDLKSLVDELYGRGFKLKFDQKMAPQLIIDGSAKTLEITEGAIRGPAEHITKVQEEFFDNISDGELLQRFGNSTIHRDAVRTVYRVKIPDLGVIAETATFSEAKALIKKTMNSLEDIRTIGMMKGVLDIDAVGGDIITRAIDEANPKVFRNTDELVDYIRNKKAPPAWRKEITNMNPEEIDQITESLPLELRRTYRDSATIRPQDWGKIDQFIKETWRGAEGLSALDAGTKPAKKYGFRLAVQKLFTTGGRMLTDPTYSTFRRVAAESGVPKLVDGFESMEKAMKNARGLLFRVSQAIEAGKSVKGVNSARRVILRPLLEVVDSKWDDAAKALNIKLTAGDREYLRRFRSLSRTLGSMFEIDPHLMWTNYLPRLRAFLDSAEGKAFAATNSNARTIMERAMGGKLPREMKFFAEYARNTEIQQFLSETDPHELLGRYAMAGIKNMTMGETFEQLRKTTNKMFTDGALDERGLNLMVHYLSDVMGMYADEASVLSHEATQRVSETFSAAMKRWTKGDPEAKAAIRDMISTFHTYTIAATMSFRPWLPIRNMQQIWTTLAGHFGNSNIMQALKRMRNIQEVNKRAVHLRETGRLMGHNPIFELTGLAYAKNKGVTGFVQNVFNKFGMALYKNSDDYTRLVVDFAVENDFADAVAKFQRGVINERQFLGLSNLRKFDAYDQRQVIKLLKEKGYRSALDYYGDVVTRETMFAYTAGSNPAMYKGFFGRIFGMFGHYPVYYLQNLRNGLRRGTPLDRLMFAGRVAFNSAALWFTFEKTMGIRADQFLPYKTMFFDGGPYFKLLSRTLSAFKGGPGAPSKAQVLREAGRIMIPGSLAFRGFVRSWDYFEKGDAYSGLLQMLSVPVAERDISMF